MPDLIRCPIIGRTGKVADDLGFVPFNAAIAFYPYCSLSLKRLKTPFLILVGEKDAWCPAALCADQVPGTPGPHELLIKIYPGAFHDFDWEGLNRVIKGRRMQYHREAAEDAIRRVRRFLEKHLGLKEG